MIFSDFLIDKLWGTTISFHNNNNGRWWIKCSSSCEVSVCEFCLLIYWVWAGLGLLKGLVINLYFPSFILVYYSATMLRMSSYLRKIWIPIEKVKHDWECSNRKKMNRGLVTIWLNCLFCHYADNIKFCSFGWDSIQPSAEVVLAKI